MKQFILILIGCFFCSQALSKPLLVGGPDARAEAYKRAQKLKLERKLDFAETYGDVLTSYYQGRLILLEDGKYYEVLHMDEGRPFVLPETKLFLERFSEYAYKKCDRITRVTSATRPYVDNKGNLLNSVPDTVHPTGMAVDLKNRDLPSRCKRWKEARLRYLEDAGVIQATKELYQPHYHTVVYPREYAAYAQNNHQLVGALYEVQFGDTLSLIAARFGRTVTELQQRNKLLSPDKISVEQKIQVDW